MTSLSTLPSLREQARRALLLIGAPAPARLVVEVHGALFDGDLSMTGLAGLLRDEERDFDRGVAAGWRICPALREDDLMALRGLVTLSTWSMELRIPQPEHDRLAAVVRIAEFIAMRESVSPAAAALLRGLAETVPGGPENLATLAHTARESLPERPAVPAATERRWAGLDERQRLFGVPGVPQQRSRA
ncbi:MAG: hypothetical protein ABW000_18835 [Actinoplanes sp.]